MSLKPFKIYLAKKRLAHAKKKLPATLLKIASFFLAFLDQKFSEILTSMKSIKKSKYNVFLKKKYS